MSEHIYDRYYLWRHYYLTKENRRIMYDESPLCPDEWLNSDMPRQDRTGTYKMKDQVYKYLKSELLCEVYSATKLEIT